METNLEKNIFIAESLGFQRTDIGWFDAEEVLNIKGSNTFDELEFDTNMNWLFSVVKYINLLDDYEYSVEIQTMDVYIYSEKNGLVAESSCDYNVDELEKSIFDAVVMFFEWYNNK